MARPLAAHYQQGRNRVRTSSNNVLNVSNYRVFSSTCPVEHNGIKRIRIEALPMDESTGEFEAGAEPAFDQPTQRRNRIPRRFVIAGSAVLVAAVGLAVFLVPGWGNTTNAAAALLENAQSTTLQVPAGQVKHLVMHTHYDYVAPSLLSGTQSLPTDMTIEEWVAQGNAH